MLFDIPTLTPSAPVVPTQLTAAMVCGYILWLLKGTKAIPWVTQHTTGINAAIRVGLSAIATLGISWQWNPTSHQLVIGNLYGPVILHGLWHWFSQYAATQLFEKVLSIAPGQNPSTP